MSQQSRQGATRRRSRWVTFDRWLDRVVSVAVITALVFGLAAVAAHWLL
ncbi:hypothetical protein [Vreelandella rituensis]|nr:hypothetical protein [Halomonas rituensis]